MIGRKHIDAIPSLAIALIAALYVWASYGYDPASRRLPWIAGVLAISCALGDFASRHLLAVARPNKSATHSPWQEARVFAWTAGFLVLVIVLGFYAAIPLYVFCYLRLHARKSAPISALAAFGLLGFLYVVFTVLMGYDMFGGLVAGDGL